MTARRHMTASPTLRAVAALFAVVATQACAMAAAGPEATRSPTISPAEFESLYRARTDSARMAYTEADIRFMTGMIGHHAQALVIAALVPGRGVSPSVRTLAARTINAQEDEIATMRQWLQDRGQPVAELHTSGTGPTVRGPGETMRMPGMLSPEQIQELDDARGSEFDRLFLAHMIQHHRGAVTMVNELFATDGAALDDAAFKIASDIQVDQTTEVARMERMLDAMPETGLSP